jgi:hypothetical protein
MTIGRLAFAHPPVKTGFHGACAGSDVEFSLLRTRARVAPVHAVHDRVLGFIAAPDTDSFEALALEIYAHQFELCEPYRRFCQSRGRGPELGNWRDIPPVPVQAFKQVSLRCTVPERTFLSTGTTAGPDLRSRHEMPDLRLYRAAARGGLERFLFPDRSVLRAVSLVPPADERPESSLAQMVAWAIADHCTGDSVYAVDSGEVNLDLCVEALRASESDGTPACLMTTTGSLIRLIDALDARRLAFRLPHGSRLMDTGGDKGAPRRMSRNGLLHACWKAFAIPGYFCVNEYGMSELSSQYYDGVIADRYAGRHRPRAKHSPPWLRTLVLDPATLRPLAPGESGLLCHFDLANAATAMAVLTEDVGTVGDDGLHVLGRASSAEIRGCSLAIDEWPDAPRAARA